MRNKPLWPFTLNQASPQANGLVGWWPGGNGGYRLLDMSGRGNHGTLTNFAAPMSATSGWVAGNGGGKGALATDGTDDCVVASGIALTGVVNCTMSIWVYRNSTATTVGAGRASSGTGTARFSFIWFSDGNAYLSCESGSLSYGIAALTGTGWHHIVMAYDGSQSTNATKLVVYIDGKAVSLTFVGTIPTSIGSTGSDNFGIGRDHVSRFCGGSYEDLRLYLRTLSAAEVAALYNPATRWQLRSQRKFVFQGADLTSHVETFTTPGSGTWTPPASVTSYVVECIGGGGAGGYSYDAGGGGGGGGDYVRSTRNCTPSVGINYHVASGSIAQVAGSENTWFVDSSTVVAFGASDGGPGLIVGGGGGGSFGSSTGDVIFAGGSGGSGGSVGGGGGASSAGSAANGNNGDNGTPSLGGAGGAAVTDGGYGGNGGDSGNAGVAGSNPGAGGGGDAVGGGTGYGTNGGNGWIRVSYIAVTVTATQSLISRCMSIPMSICTR